MWSFGQEKHSEPKCTMSTGVSYSKSSLNSHVKAKHEKIRHLCPYCKKKDFTSQDYCTKHIRTCMNAMPMSCEKCGDTFNSEYNTIEGSYKCIFNKATRYYLMIEKYMRTNYMPRNNCAHMWFMFNFMTIHVDMTIHVLHLLSPSGGKYRPYVIICFVESLLSKIAAA